MAAVGGLPKHLLERLVLFVHDELVFEVPEAEAEQTMKEVEEIMLRTGAWLLEPWGVPVESEGAVSESWKH